MPPGTPFGPGIRSLLADLHHSHHVSSERLARMLKELFGLTISEGAIANAFRRMGAAVLGGHQPEVWISDRYAGQQGVGQVHQVCLAHVLRDVQYAIDCGDSVVAHLTEY